MNENEAKTLIERFAEKQQGGHFARPRCGRMAMDAESVTRNALSRRATAITAAPPAAGSGTNRSLSLHTVLIVAQK